MRQHPALKLIDHWLNYQFAQGDLPGFQVSIRQGSKLIYSRAFGYANIEKKEKYTSRHLGRMASQSKMFTATLALILEAKGLLNLNDPVTKYLPEFANHKDKRFNKITLTHLLSNRAGVFRDSFDHNYWGENISFLSREDLLKEVMAHSLVYQPGRFTKYSNVGFALMGLILEKASGKNYSKLIEDHIFAQMPNAALTADFVIAEKNATGYLRKQFDGQSFSVVKNRVAHALAPAAGFCGNTEATTQFVHSLFKTNKFLNSKQRARMHTEKWAVKNLKSDFYGFGTITTDVDANTYVGHSGGFVGFASQTWCVPESGLTFGFITNTSAAKMFNVARSMCETFAAINSNFKASELNSIIVSEPMIENFGSTLYAVGKTKALVFSLPGWLLTDGLVRLNKHKDYFVSEDLSGYMNVGEPVRFYKQAGQISAVKFGGFLSRIRNAS